MKLINTLCLAILLLISNTSLGQFNIQTGYDFGYFTRQNDKKSPLNSVHRINITSEYLLKSNIFFSLNTGIDFHYFNYNIQRRMTYSSGNNSYDEVNYGKINIQNYRLGLSLGYQFNISNNSCILFNVAYHQYFVNKVSIRESYKTTTLYNVSEDQIDNSDPVSTIEEFDPLINLKDIGYRNKLIRENRNIIFSAQYRYQFNKYFVAPSIGFSALNRGALGRSGQNILFFGVNFGYTFSQKTKENDK